jgi:DNA mismatch repair protein MutS
MAAVGVSLGTRREAGFLLAFASNASLQLMETRAWEFERGARMSQGPRSKIVGFDQARRLRAAGESMPTTEHHSSRFYSILFASPADRARADWVEAAAFFPDLNCDQIVAGVTAGRDEYNLTPFFHTCLQRAEAIRYRHEVMQDLELAPVYETVSSFAAHMTGIREHLRQVQKMYYKEQKEAWFRDAIEIYCAAIKVFAADLHTFDLHSRGFLSFRDYVANYVRSTQFCSLADGVDKLKADLATVEYCVLIRGDRFTVTKYEGEADYSVEVEHTFEKFKQGAVKDYRVNFAVSVEMNHIEAKILEFVARLFPKVFGPLEEFCNRNQNFIDPVIAAFDREVQFYLAYFEYAGALKRAGLSFCYPRISSADREVYNRDGFDIALAHKLLKENSSVVCNDFHLRGRERILVVSGPNQGGKTTFARAFGQVHYLASIGLPVPGKEAQLFLFDDIFTHFEKEEKVENLRGKLEDDLLRIHSILDRATPHSIIILNEIFTSTTIKDETFLSEKMMEKIIALGALCIWVTFVDELASFGPQVVSMVSTVVPENPALRTFKILRRPADGLAYAMAIAQKYGLTYEAIRNRIRP